MVEEGGGVLWVPEPPGRRGDDGCCRVRGCDREGEFTVQRFHRFNLNGRPAEKMSTVRYCAEHYGQANQFRAGRAA